MTTVPTFSPESLERFQQDGYLILKDFLSVKECQEFINQAANLVKEFDPKESSTIFSTTVDNTEARDAYFLHSGDKIRFFWEKDVFHSNGSLRVPKEKGINKIGHALHDLDPVFSRLSRLPQIKTLLQALKWIDPLIVQSMYIFKQPERGGEVVWHQDQTYLETSPGTILGLWMALEDATIENGCLWAIPGEHQAGLKKRFVRQNLKTSTEVLDDSPWDEGKKISLEVPQGSVILLHGLLPHKSEENLSAKSRQAYTLHFMERTWQFSPQNWLQRDPQFPFTGF